jgi:hypothetical protein
MYNAVQDGSEYEQSFTYFKESLKLCFNNIIHFGRIHNGKFQKTHLVAADVHLRLCLSINPSACDNSGTAEQTFMKLLLGNFTVI